MLLNRELDGDSDNGRKYCFPPITTDRTGVTECDGILIDKNALINARVKVRSVSSYVMT
jgi:hypothetical protein